MTVYVDNFRTRAQVGGGRPAIWSHMTADTRDELHAFAARLGLRRSWFQDPVVNGKPKAKPGSRHAEHWHYDVTETVRQKAIRAGAVEVSWREFPGICAGRTARRCRCVPCTTPGRGHPTIEHCAACCAGSGIEEYDHRCPVAEHRSMAAQQHAGDPIPLDEARGNGPVVEHVTSIGVTENADGTVALFRVDGTIIGPRSIARPEAVEARRLADERDGGQRTRDLCPRHAGEGGPDA